MFALSRMTKALLSPAFLIAHGGMVVKAEAFIQRDACVFTGLDYFTSLSRDAGGTGSVLRDAVHKLCRKLSSLCGEIRTGLFEAVSGDGFLKYTMTADKLLQCTCC